MPIGVASSPSPASAACVAPPRSWVFDGEILTGVKTGCWFALQRPSGTLARVNAWCPCSPSFKPSCKMPSIRHPKERYSSLTATGAAQPISVRISTGSQPDLNRIINRAGLTAWPRLFNAMRASRATELASQYPAATCTAWLGHTQAIAEAHYYMVRDEDFDRAASTTASNQTAPNSASQSGANSGAHAAQIRAQQQAASTSRAWQSDAQTKEGSALMPIPAGRCNALHVPGNGRGGTRTHDISRVRRTL